MSAAHTPGPWTMETVRTSCGVVFKVGPFPWKHGKLNHACIYADYPSTEGHAICTANARLIAAAPDLLAAAERIEKRIAYYASVAEADQPNIEEWAYTDASGDAAALRAAIAKATGATS